MYLSQQTLSKWKTLYQTGDKTKIAGQYVVENPKASLSTVQGWISLAFKHGICTETLFKVIDTYYKKVEKQLKKTA